MALTDTIVYSERKGVIEPVRKHNLTDAGSESSNITRETITHEVNFVGANGDRQNYFPCSIHHKAGLTNHVWLMSNLLKVMTMYVNGLS